VTAFADTTDLPSGKDATGRQLDALARATDLIRGALGGQQIVRVEDDVVTLEGNGRWILQLPQVPVVAVTSVVVGGLVHTAGIHYTVASDTGRLTSLGYPWPVGARVVVTYTHGYDFVPEDLARLCASLADKILDGSLRYRSVQESIGSKQSSISYLQPASGNPQPFDAADEQVLDKYRLSLLP
jgi:hypothetical protein